MDKVHVIYGSTTGMTEAVAEKIAKALDAQAFNVNAGDAAAFDAELLVLGSSTWGVGDLQDDWAAQLDGVKANFAGKKVATFGLGDSVGFADSFCVAAETLATAAKDAGATSRRSKPRFELSSISSFGFSFFPGLSGADRLRHPFLCLVSVSGRWRAAGSSTWPRRPCRGDRSPSEFLLLRPYSIPKCRQKIQLWKRINVSLPNMPDFGTLWSSITHSEIVMIGRKDELKRLKAAYASPASIRMFILGKPRHRRNCAERRLTCSLIGGMASPISAR